MYNRTKKDAQRVKRVRAKLVAAKRVEEVVPTKLVSVPVQPPLEDACKKDAFDPGAYTPREKIKYTPSYFDKEAKKAEAVDASRETPKKTSTKKRKKKKDKR